MRSRSPSQDPATRAASPVVRYPNLASGGTAGGVTCRLKSLGESGRSIQGRGRWNPTFPAGSRLLSWFPRWTQSTSPTFHIGNWARWPLSNQDSSINAEKIGWKKSGANSFDSRPSRLRILARGLLPSYRPWGSTLYKPRLRMYQQYAQPELPAR